MSLWCVFLLLVIWHEILTKSFQCEACHNEARPGFCFSVMGPHLMKLTPSSNSESYVPIPRLPAPWTPQPESSVMTGILNTSSEPTSSSSMQTGNTSAPSAPPVIHRGVFCDFCNEMIEGIRHKCLDCPSQFLILLIEK
jgi:hypothetical protein